MATPTYGVPLQEFYGETAITLSNSVPGYINTRPGYRGAKVYCASLLKLQLTPRLHSVLFYDYSDSESYTEYVSQATDCDLATHVQLDSMAHGATTGDYLYIGCQDTFLGVYFTIDSTNKNSINATMDTEYSDDEDDPTSFTDVSDDDDGTDSTGTETGNTMEQTGVYTWTLPSDWVKTTIDGKKLYWIRMKPDATLSSNVEVEMMTTVHNTATYGWVQGGQSELFTFDTDLIGGFQYLSSSGTPSLYITWVRYRG